MNLKKPMTTFEQRVDRYLRRSNRRRARLVDPDTGRVSQSMDSEAKFACYAGGVVLAFLVLLWVVL